MEQATKDCISLGLEPLEALGFSTEDELLDALVPLMEEINIEHILLT